MERISQNSIRVLIIEDNPGDAFLIEHMIAEFENMKAETRVAASVAEAEQLLRSELFSLIISDLDLPDSSGLTTVERILSKDQALPLIVLTGGDGRETAVDAIRLGAQDFLEKELITTASLERVVSYSVERQSLNRALQTSLAEVESANARFVNLVADLTDAVVVLDISGKILFVNPAAEELLLKDSRMLVGDDFGLPIDGTAPAEVDLVDRAGRERTAEIRVVETQWDGQAAKLASLRDITDRKRAERAMRLAQQAAETANEMKSRFLANMSHELRTPLNSIIGFSEVMKDETFGTFANPRYVEYAGDIHRSGHHLLSLINDLLDLSKAESGRYEFPETEFDLVEALREAVRLVAVQADEKSLTLETELAWKTCSIRGGERQIMQVVVNLLSNAIKFTPEGGRIILRLRPGSLGSIVIEVEDTGIGIDPQDVPKVFDAYSQVGEPYRRNKAGGTGLGLALCKRLVEMHGGFMRLYSLPGAGTTVSMTLPRERMVENTSSLTVVGARS